MKQISKSKRPSRRNTVMRMALAPRPTLEGVRAKDASCPICGISADHLHLRNVAPYRTTSYALRCLGIVCRRWERNAKVVACDNCEGEFFGPDVHQWNYCQHARHFADFGQVSLPQPTRWASRQQSSLTTNLSDQLHPKKKSLINLRLRSRLLSASLSPQRRILAEAWSAGRVAVQTTPL